MLAAGEDEPAPFRILRPTEVGRATKTARGMLSEEDVVAMTKLGFDGSKLLAFMSDGESVDEAGYFFLLTRQTKTDDRVVLLDHGHEPGWPFGRKKTIAKPFMAFVERWVATARKRTPLNPFDGL